MILLDTHVLIWWTSIPEKLSKSAQSAIEGQIKSKKQILVSAISIWEIYLLVKKDRLKLALDIESWRKKLEELPELQFVPVDNTIAAKSVILPDPLHADPADRMIVATAREYGATLITSDKQLLNYPHVRSLW